MWSLFTFLNVDSQGKAYENQAAQLESNYAGSIGKATEPLIIPLGFVDHLIWYNKPAAAGLLNPHKVSIDRSKIITGRY